MPARPIYDYKSAGTQTRRERKHGAQGAVEIPESKLSNSKKMREKMMRKNEVRDSLRRGPWFTTFDNALVVGTFAPLANILALRKIAFHLRRTESVAGGGHQIPELPSEMQMQIGAAVQERRRGVTETEQVIKGE